ncbi:MAG: DUF4340 domain-containing protein [Polyangiales bacterium]
MKSVIVHALLALFGLGFAYQTWTRKPDEETTEGSVAITECDVAGLSKLSLDTPTLEVRVEPVRENNDTKFWITTRHRTPDEIAKLKAAESGGKPDAAAKADAHGDTAEDGHAEAKPDDAKPDDAKPDDAKPEDPAKPKELPESQRPKRFLANTAFRDYLKRLTPVRAQRSLGKLDKAQDADFGFDKGGTVLQLECSGRALELVAGARAFGASQRYLRDPKSEITYLMDEQLVSELESSQFKFMQSDLHDFKSEDIEEVSVSAQGAKVRLLHRDRKVADQAQWVDEKSPAKRNELFNNWFTRLGRLRARAYLPPTAEPGSDLKGAATGSTPVLALEYKVADKPTGKLELVRVDESGLAHYYARTETTRGWVTLFDSAAKEVEQDVGMVVGVEQPSSRAETADKPTSGAKAPSSHSLPAGHPQVPAGH